MSVFRQVVSAVIVCFPMLSLNMMFVWPSSTIKAFASKDTPLDRPMSDMELNFFGSMFAIMAMVATPFPAYLLNILGRKKSCILLTLPQVIAWTLISVSNKVEIILAATCISGVGGCSMVVVPLYIVEISQKHIRGTLTAGTTILAAVGTVLSYVLGGYLSYRTMNYVCLTIAVLAVALLSFVKESPTFFMKRGLEKDAAKSIAFYRSVDVNDKEVIEEINALKRILNPVLDDNYRQKDSCDKKDPLSNKMRILLCNYELYNFVISHAPEEQQLKQDSDTKRNLSTLQFMKKSRSTRRGLFLVMTILFLSIIQGMPIVMVYAKPIFQEAMPSISANTTSAVLAMVNLVSGLFAAYMLDVLGRRALMMYASLGTGISCLVLGTQIQLHWGPSWMTAVFMLSYCITYTIGPGTVPFVLVAEVFLPEIKGILTVVTIEWAWCCTFIALFIFNPLVNLLGLGVLFYIFTLGSLSTVVFAYFYLVETKGLTVDLIQTSLIKQKI